jgi:hypothetical protein
MSSSRWRDSDSASFASTNTDPLSSPTDGSFSNYGTLPDAMFIDTQAANKSGKPAVVVSEAESSTSSARRYEQDEAPLMETFVGQDVPPPSYLEATTPMPWESAPGGEGSRLLAPGRASFSPMTPGREEMGHRDGKYRKRSFGDQFSRKKMFKWIGATLALIILAAIIMALATKDRVSTSCIALMVVFCACKC